MCSGPRGDLGFEGLLPAQPKKEEPLRPETALELQNPKRAPQDQP